MARYILILVEIETPRKRWFTAGGVQHSDLVHALTQLASWRSWFNSPVNQQVFLEYYRIPADLLQTRRLRPLYALIHGTRREFDDTPGLNHLRGSLERPDELLMTFDRLSPDEKAQNMMCVRLIDNPTGRRYEAMTVPPTLTLGPLEAGYRSIVTGKEEAVGRNALMGRERKEFVIRRIPYWDNWARTRSGSYRIDLDARE